MTSTPADDKFFDNVYRFVALCATSEEYLLHISDGLIKLDLQMVAEEYKAKNYTQRQINKIIEKRERELVRIYANRQKFFADFVKRFNMPPFTNLVDGYVDKLNDALTTISVKDANIPNQPEPAVTTESPTS